MHFAPPRAAPGTDQSRPAGLDIKREAQKSRVLRVQYSLDSLQLRGMPTGADPVLPGAGNHFVVELEGHDGHATNGR